MNIKKINENIKLAEDLHNRGCPTDSVLEDLYAKKNEMEKKMNTNDKVNVGDVFNMTWGYDQTNQNFYQVVKKIGKTMVEIMEIACKNIDVQEYGENVTFDRGNFIGEPIKKKVLFYTHNDKENIYLNMTSYAIATPTTENEKHWVTGWAYGH